MGQSFSRSKQKKGQGPAQSNGRGHASYSMKVLIRGERGAGKTTMLKRIAGVDVQDAAEDKPLEPPAYVPSTKIQGATLSWKWRENEGSEGEVIKLSFLDIIDDLPEISQVDFYDDNSVGAVVFVIDLRQEWSSYYLVSELQRVPAHVPILVFGNFLDAGERKTHNFQVQAAFPRIHDSNNMIVYTEGSALTGLGLFVFRRYIQWAFLVYQRHLWEEMLRGNAQRLEHAWSELRKSLEEAEKKGQQQEIWLENGATRKDVAPKADQELQRHISFLLGSGDEMVLLSAAGGSSHGSLDQVTLMGSSRKKQQPTMKMLEEAGSDAAERGRDEDSNSEGMPDRFKGLNLDTSSFWR